MPADRKFKVTNAGTEVEVEVPKGWLHEADIAETHTLKTEFEPELQRRVASITKDRKTPDELLADEKFLERIAKEKKDPLIKLLGITPGKQGDVDIGKLTTEVTERVRRDELKPIQDQLAATQTETEGLRIRTLDAQTVEAAHALRVPDDLIDLVKLHVRSKVAWDKEHGEFFVRKADGDGFLYSANPKQGGFPFMGVREFLETIQKVGEHKSWFGDGLQPGADFRGSQHGSGTTLVQFEALSPREKTQFAIDHPEQHSKFMEEIRTKGETKLFAHSR